MSAIEAKADIARSRLHVRFLTQSGHRECDAKTSVFDPAPPFVTPRPDARNCTPNGPEANITVGAALDLLLSIPVLQSNISNLEKVKQR